MQALRDATPLSVWREVLDDPQSPKNAGLSLRLGSAENHYFHARGALARDEDLKHGLLHLAELLAIEPGRGEWLAMLDRYRERIGDLVPNLGGANDKPYFATEAVRAYEWARRGDMERAITRLVDVVTAKPTAPHLDAWGLGWVEPIADRIDPVLLTKVLGAVLRTLPEHDELVARREDAARRWARIAVEQSKRLHGAGVRVGLVDMMTAGVCRKAGLLDEALAMADAEARPSWDSWCARGLVFRARGETDAALAAFERAGACDPAAIATYLEAGDALFVAERWREARAYYERALQVQHDSSWALASIAYCGWKESGPAVDAPLPEALSAELRRGNRRAQELRWNALPFVGYVPEPSDATANMLRQLPRGASASLACSEVEAPSNLVLAAMLGAQVSVTWSHVASPDPRLPVGDVAFSLWRREGEVLVAAMGPPPAALRNAIAALAARPFHRRRAWAEASRLARSMRAEDAAAILACAVHPPPTPDGLTPHAWLPRVQLAVAFTVAQLACDEPWERSARRAALRSLLLGPMDWTTESAIVAVTALVVDEPITQTEMHAAFARLLAARPDAGACPWETTLLYEWRLMPGLFPDEREAINARLARTTSSHG